MQRGSTSEASNVEADIDKLERALKIASENGLFSDSRRDREKFEQIERLITTALRALEVKQAGPEPNRRLSPKSNQAALEAKRNQGPDIITARRELAGARRLFDLAINNAPLRWRYSYEYGIPMFVFLLAVLSGVISLWAFHLIRMDTKILTVPAWAFSWGVLGSTLQGLWSLWQSVSERYFRKNWLIYYLSIPLIGGLLGAFTYLAFFAGFIAATGQTQVTNDSVPILLAGLAGFSWNWSINVLNNVAKIFRASSS